MVSLSILQPICILWHDVSAKKANSGQMLYYLFACRYLKPSVLPTRLLTAVSPALQLVSKEPTLRGSTVTWSVSTKKLSQLTVVMLLLWLGMMDSSTTVMAEKLI